MGIVGAFQNTADGHAGALAVGHLNAHGRLAGDGGFNTYVCNCKVQRDIVCKVGDAADLHTGAGLQLITGDRGAAGNIQNTGLHTKAFQSGNQLFGIGFQLQAGILRFFLLGVEQAQRRVAIHRRSRFFSFRGRGGGGLLLSGSGLAQSGIRQMLNCDTLPLGYRRLGINRHPLVLILQRGRNNAVRARAVRGMGTHHRYRRRAGRNGLRLRGDFLHGRLRLDRRADHSRRGFRQNVIRFYRGRGLLIFRMGCPARPDVPFRILFGIVGGSLSIVQSSFHHAAPVGHCAYSHISLQLTGRLLHISLFLIVIIHTVPDVTEELADLAEKSLSGFFFRFRLLVKHVFHFHLVDLLAFQQLFSAAVVAFFSFSQYRFLFVHKTLHIIVDHLPDLRRGNTENHHQGADHQHHHDHVGCGPSAQAQQQSAQRQTRYTAAENHVRAVFIADTYHFPETGQTGNIQVGKHGHHTGKGKQTHGRLADFRHQRLALCKADRQIDHYNAQHIHAHAKHAKQRRAQHVPHRFALHKQHDDQQHTNAKQHKALDQLFLLFLFAAALGPLSAFGPCAGAGFLFGTGFAAAFRAAFSAARPGRRAFCRRFALRLCHSPHSSLIPNHRKTAHSVFFPLSPNLFSETYIL